MKSKLSLARISLDFADAPLEDVIAFIRSVVGVNILIDPEVFKTHDRSSLKVTLTVKDLRAESALNLLLSFHKLSKQYTSGVLLITTKDRVDDKVYTVIYSVRDMMFSLRDFKGPNIDITQASGPGTTITDPAEENPSNELANPDRLMEVIRDNAARGSWESGSKTSIKMIRGLLVVNQTRSGHYDVNRLLMLLRGFR